MSIGSISEVFRIKAGVGSRMHVFPDSFSATTLDFKHAGHLKKFEPRGPAGKIIIMKISVWQINKLFFS